MVFSAFLVCGSLSLNFGDSGSSASIQMGKQAGGFSARVIGESLAMMRASYSPWGGQHVRGCEDPRLSSIKRYHPNRRERTSGSLVSSSQRPALGLFSSGRYMKVSVKHWAVCWQNIGSLKRSVYLPNQMSRREIYSLGGSFEQLMIFMLGYLPLLLCQDRAC